MKNLQRTGLKILIALLTLLNCNISLSLGQTSSFRLKTADSLFITKRYTQSLEHYNEILKQKQYSPAMLLKMAFIQEGLNNIGQAMYYLNLYFLITRDESVQEKMESLATKYNLEGYKTTDTDWFLSFYYNHYRKITLALAALAIFMLSLIFHTRIKLHKRPLASGIIAIILVIVFFVHLNFGDRISTGIITNAKTYVMNGPSAAASVVEIIKDGHRVEVVGKKDIWLKIMWNDEIAYIRNNCLQPLGF